MLLDDICDFLLPSVATRLVTDVRVGLGYTAVQLDDGHCGLAYTFRNEIAEDCCVLREAGTLAGRPASALAEWAKSPDPGASAVGLATLNALIGAPPHATQGDILTALEITSHDVIGMVGYFQPLAGPLRSRARALHVFERRPNAESGVLPEAAAAPILPQCNIVILSATTLLNRTLDDLLVHCRNAREVAILGPTTPLLPALFAGRGVTLLAGVYVTDPNQVLRVVGEGGGARQLRTGTRKLTVRCASR